MNIADYYDKLARTYDANRFDNSYGQFLHRRELNILHRLLPKSAHKILDLGCGTGRFSGLASDGLDQSREMIEVARAKHPDKIFTVGDARKLPFENSSFEAIFCLHVVMHLPENELVALFSEVRRVLKTGGVFVVDFPSRKRRKLLGHRADGWHGATSFDLDSLEKLVGPGWKMGRSEGVLWLPVQRFPAPVRRFFDRPDSFFGRSWLRGWSSYLFVSLEKLETNG